MTNDVIQHTNGPAWQNPTLVLQPRLVKFGGAIDF
jgi:hypothetical protein